jgi:hypothetical protein
MMEYIKKIQKHNIFKFDLMDYMLGILLTSYESMYQQVNGLTTIPTLEDMTTRLLQAKTHL